MSVYGGEHSKDGDREFVPQAEGRLAGTSDTPRDLTLVLRSLTLEAVALTHDVSPLKPKPLRVSMNESGQLSTS